MPRRSVLTEDVTEKMSNALRVGAFVTVAAPFSGIREDRHYEWMSRGEAYEKHLEDGGEAIPVEEPYHDYFVKCTAARAEAQMAALAAWSTQIRNPKEKVPGWRAAMEYLRRTDPANWEQLGMQRVGLEISGPGGGPVQLAAVEQTLSDSLRASLPALKARLEAGDDDSILDVEIVDDVPEKGGWASTTDDEGDEYMYAAWTGSCQDA